MAEQRSSHPRRWITKAFLVDLVVVAVVLVTTLTFGQRQGFRDFDATGIALALLASLPLIGRRRAPLATFAAVAAAAAALVALGYVDQVIGPLVALYFLGASPEEGRDRTWLTAATVAGLFFLHVSAYFNAAVRDDHSGVPPPLVLAYWAIAWFVGDRMLQRRVRIAELEERALLAERAAEREHRLAAAEERARIARDLHDSAGHAINVILVEAGAARLLQEQDPKRSRAALQTIEEVARETIGEIDQLVRALRENGSTDEVEPPPGLAALDALAERHRSAGLSVTTGVRGARRQLAPAVDRAAYRILQEALTNASRHGRGEVEVEIAFESEALELSVANPAQPGRPAARGGHGIVGMRERAALLGGSIEAGEHDGSFHVRARLPYSGERS